MPDGSLGLRQAHAHILAGQQQAVGVGHLGPQRDLARVASTVRSENSSLPGLGNSLPSSSTTRTAAPSRHAQLFGGNGLAQAQHVGGGLGEVHIHRADLLDDGQLRGLAALTSAPSVTSDWPMRPDMGA
jgi:hypothetical protein